MADAQDQTGKPEKPGKRLVFCFDGTWNRLAVAQPTNVAMMAQMIRPIASDGIPQIVYYDEGIGANRMLPRRLCDGAMGLGMLRIMRDAYRFLIFNYQAGDEIYALGFSRGAFTARSFLSFVRHAGIIDARHANQIDNAVSMYRDAPVDQTGLESGLGLRFRYRFCTASCVSLTDREFRMRRDPKLTEKQLPLINLRYLGAWDTVRSLGVPGGGRLSAWINKKYEFHDANITSKLTSARHAVALDEMRRNFRPTLFGRQTIAKLNGMKPPKGQLPPPPWALNYQEKWFPGVHGAVGGGGSRRGLSDAALGWIMQGAVKMGLELRSRGDALTYHLRPRFSENLENVATQTVWNSGVFGWLRSRFGSPRSGPTDRDEIALPTFQRWFAPPLTLDDEVEYRPGALAAMGDRMQGWPHGNFPEIKSAHLVQRGDNLSRIAHQHFGDARLYYEVFGANLDRLDDPGFLTVGQTLRLPIVRGAWVHADKGDRPC